MADGELVLDPDVVPDRSRQVDLDEGNGEEDHRCAEEGSRRVRRMDEEASLTGPCSIACLDAIAGACRRSMAAEQDKEGKQAGKRHGEDRRH